MADAASLRSQRLDEASSAAPGAAGAHASHAALEAELRAQAALLSELEDAAGVGFWRYDFGAERPQWSREVFRIHEWEEAEPPRLADAIAFYEPAERETLRGEIERAFETGEGLDFERRIITARGRKRWVRCRMRVHGEPGAPTRLYGVFADVTARREAEEALRDTAAAARAEARRLAAARREAEDAARARSAFAEAASARLREPLSGLIGALEVIRKGCPPETERRLLALAEQAGREAARLIDALQEAVSLETRSEPAPERPTDLGGVLSEVLLSAGADAAPVAELRGVVARVEPERLVRLVGLMLDANAGAPARFSARIDAALAGEAWLRLETETETGADPGCAAASAAADREAAGLARDLGGSFSREARADGGARRRAELPVRLLETRREGRACRALAGRRVLVCDADSLQRLVLCEMLERAGAEATPSAPGAPLTAALRRDAFDAVLVAPAEARSPEAVIAPIRAASPANADAPVLALCASPPDASDCDCRRSYAGVLMKPVDGDALIDAVLALPMRPRSDLDKELAPCR